MHGQTSLWLILTSASLQLPVPSAAPLGRQPGRMARTTWTFAAPAGRRTSKSVPRTAAEAEVDTEVQAFDEIEAVAIFSTQSRHLGNQTGGEQGLRDQP